MAGRGELGSVGGHVAVRSRSPPAVIASTRRKRAWDRP
jgi:hypothetical protein